MQIYTILIIYLILQILEIPRIYVSKLDKLRYSCKGVGNARRLPVGVQEALVLQLSLYLLSELNLQPYF